MKDSAPEGWICVNEHCYVSSENEDWTVEYSPEQKRWLLYEVCGGVKIVHGFGPEKFSVLFMGSIQVSKTAEPEEEYYPEAYE